MPLSGVSKTNCSVQWRLSPATNGLAYMLTQPVLIHPTPATNELAHAYNKRSQKVLFSKYNFGGVDKYEHCFIHDFIHCKPVDYSTIFYCYILSCFRSKEWARVELHCQTPLSCQCLLSQLELASVATICQNGLVLTGEQQSLPNSERWNSIEDRIKHVFYMSRDSLISHTRQLARQEAAQQPKNASRPMHNQVFYKTSYSSPWSCWLSFNELH